MAAAKRGAYIFFEVVDLYLVCGEKRIDFAAGERLIEVLWRGGVALNAPCGGKGICGKCFIETAGKVCLACLALGEDFDGAEVFVRDSGAMDVLEAYKSLHPAECDRGLPDGALGIAVDIGTTTIALQLLDMYSGRPVAAFSMENSQRRFGADVISRTEFANKGGLEQLRDCIIGDICHGVAALGGLDAKLIVIAGNTTMLHILQGLPCNTLGVHPFAAVSLGLVRLRFPELAGDCVILPGFSTFVGADIAAGILSCCSENSLLIDLGTNGEMALMAGNKIFVTATAAGPAFEGGNISAGVASVAGAIAKVKYNPAGQVFEYETIGGVPPVGICGTGMVDATAELIKHGLVAENGKLNHGNNIQIGGKNLTQKDIREMQLAKSAIRSGIEILLHTAGMAHNDIANVYLAGGFGHKINIENACVLGIIPKELHNKTTAIGNASLRGAAQVLLSQAKEANIVVLAQSATEVNLASHPMFNDLFMDNLMLGM